MPSNDELNTNISKLNSNLAKLTSFKRVFFMSVIQGVGGVIGATVIAGVILFVLSKFIVSIEQIPLIGPWVRTITQFSYNIKPDASAYPTATLTPTTEPTVTPTSTVTASPKPTQLPSLIPTTI